MAIITQLDKHLIEKIAAGEVVERPASVIKELVENALDAGATSVTVEIREGGLSYIRVTDNGSGMDEQDARNCFLPHATSKIQSDKDLMSIATLGFRGEALSSICEVSKVTLFTRQPGSEAAITVENHGGEIVSVRQTGQPEGTTVIVEDLFYNIPARLKFAKRPTAEAALVSHICLQYILARPFVAFRFVSNGKDIYRSSGDGELLNAIYAVYGSEVSDKMVRLSYQSDGLEIQGYIGNSHLVRASRGQQSLFVNGRYIKSDIISNAIKQGYQNRIMPAKHPVFVLNLTIPYEEVDVNVHPNKMDLRFVREDLVTECFFKATKKALDDFYTMPKMQPPTQPTPQPKPISPPDYTSSINKNIENLFAADGFSSKLPKSVNQSVLPALTKVVEQVTRPAPEQEQTVLLPQDDLEDYRIIGQLFLTYILIEYQDNFLMIDQHAAHERINANLLQQQLEEQNVASQNLLLPFLLQVSAGDYQQIIENLEHFQELGFVLEAFGDNTVKITALPSILGEPQLQDFFLDAVDQLGSLRQGRVELKKDKLFQTACKHSIKGGEKLSAEEIRYLIQETMVHKTPLHCPHGRPIVIVKSKTQIEKMFGRIV